ncbi:MAG: signal peptidase I [Dehalococcoidales bacterium]|nr:signal peptidase I [Dehalococcoidales bacterium]
MSSQAKNTIREIVFTVVAALVIFFALQATVQSSPIVGSCMEPSLQEEGQRLLINKVIYHFHEPERGDIIVFHPPKQPASALPYIKRVIGLPGETVEVKSGNVYINGEILDEPYLKESPTYTLSPLQIPEDNYFVLGDNRNVANDSHVWGTVPRENLIGKAWLSIWPPESWGTAPNYSFEAS